MSKMKEQLHPVTGQVMTHPNLMGPGHTEVRPHDPRSEMPQLVKGKHRPEFQPQQDQPQIQQDRQQEQQAPSTLADSEKAAAAALKAYIDGPLTRVEQLSQLAITKIAELNRKPSSDPEWREWLGTMEDIRSKAGVRKKAFFEEKRSLKKPHEEKAARIEKAFSDVIGRLDDITKVANDMATAYNQVKAAEASEARRVQIEAERQVAEKARQERMAAEEEARKANDINRRREAEENARRRHEEQRIAESRQAAAIAAKPADKQTEIVETAEGRVRVTTRSVISDVTVTNAPEFLQWCADNYSEMPDFLKVLKTGIVKASKALNGNIPGTVPVLEDKTSRRNIK